MTSIFLAHSSKDKPFARKLASRLERAGVKVWIDEAQILVGDSLLEKLEDGIRGSQYLGAILSPDSINSKWVKRELRAALTLEIDQQVVKVLPIMYKQCDIPLFLSDKIWADFTDPGKFDDGMSTLLDRLLVDKIFAIKPWSVRAVRIGLDCGLLVGDSGGIDFSNAFLEQLCSDAHDWQKGEYTNWMEFILSAMSNAITDDGTGQISLCEEEVVLLFSDATMQVYKLLLGIGVDAEILYATERIGVHDHFNDEIYAARDSQKTEEEPREFILRMFIEISRAKLVLSKHVHADLFRIVGMLAFSMWTGKSYFDDLEGLEGDQRTELSGVTHPGGAVSLKELGQA